MYYHIVLSKQSSDEYLKRLEQTQWSNDIAELLYCNLLTDIDAMTDHFNTILRDTLNKHAPANSHSVRLRPNSSWFFDDLRKLKREKHLCERKLKSTNPEIHRQLYKDACRTYTTALNSVKTGYYREKISCSSNDQLFKMINGLFRVKAYQSLSSHESLSAIVKTFNNYFHSKIEKMRSELEQSDYITNDLSINEQFSICQSTFLEFN